MARYLVSVDLKSECKVEEYRVDADSPVQAAYLIGIHIGVQAPDGYNDTAALNEIVAVNKIVETFDKEWSL